MSALEQHLGHWLGTILGLFILFLQVSPEDRRKLEVEVMVNNLEILVLALFKLGFFQSSFSRNTGE